MIMSHTDSPRGRSMMCSKAPQYTFTINAAPDTDSHDSFEGSKYSKITTDGLSAGTFGDIGMLHIVCQTSSFDNMPNSFLEGPMLM